MEGQVGRPAVEARDIWLSYDGNRPVLKGVSLRVERGQVFMVLGPSGSGKTTFLKVVKGLLSPQRGSLSVLGADLSRNGSWKKCPGQRIAYIPQNLGLVRSLSVTDNALTGALGRTATLPSLFKAFPHPYRMRAREFLETMGIGHKAEEKVYRLSGGERQRVAIARALMQEPELILADEFVAQLDPLRTLEIMDIVREIASRGVAFLITSHEPELVAQYGDRAVFLREGQKVHECPAREVSLDMVKALTA